MSSDSTSTYPRTHRVLPLLAGALLVAATFVVDLLIDGRGATAPAQALLIGVGCALAVAGLASRHLKFGAVLTKLSILVLAVVFTVTLLEVGFRLADHDFAREGRAARAVPIFYRRPTLHAGEGFYRRPGPATWRGRPLSAFAALHALPDTHYAGEQPIVVEYDPLGFRNPPDLTDWDVVVVGDSFVELGFLPYDQIFTTCLARRLGLRVKNLGVSHTGPLSHEFYLRNYGKAPSARDAILCFFEGNDLHDLELETRHAAHFRKTGQAAIRGPRRQTSLLRAMYDVIRDATAPNTSPRPSAPMGSRYGQNAWFLAGRTELPMTIGVAPPAWDELRDDQREKLLNALSASVTSARALGMRPWILYIPDAHRVSHGYVRYMDPDSKFSSWKPNDFPDRLGRACRELGAEFIDPYPALRREVEAGRSPYNLIADTHVNALGARVIADVIADAMTAAAAAARGQ